MGSEVHQATPRHVIRDYAQGLRASRVHFPVDKVQFIMYRGAPAYPILQCSLVSCCTSTYIQWLNTLLPNLQERSPVLLVLELDL
jgi:hypothetical protein